MNWKLNSDEETILKNMLLWIVQKDVLRAGSETRRERMTQWQTFAGVLGMNELWANRITDNKASDSFQRLSPARQAQVLVECVTFDPYKDVLKLPDKVRLDALAIVLQGSDVVPADLPKKLVDEFHWILGRTNRVKARNAVTIGVLGAGAGILTLGLAAPAIGATIGGIASLSGAAASSFGLAWLGGGALAAGGSGMAGGTALLSMLGLAAGTMGGTAAGWAIRQAQALMLQEVIKLHLLVAVALPAIPDVPKESIVDLYKQLVFILNEWEIMAKKETEKGNVRSLLPLLRWIVARTKSLLVTAHLI